MASRTGRREHVSERTESADVVVVGCGPGGAVLAYLLARSGVDVALGDRQ
nr:FAD-dependent monooxygenase [Halobacterium sp. CBA1126]